MLSFEKSAVFPSVYSKRAVRQLEMISSLLEQGYKGCYVIVSLNSAVDEIRINRDERQFYASFCRCVDKGMNYRGYAVALKNNKAIVIKKSIQVII